MDSNHLIWFLTYLCLSPIKIEGSFIQAQQVSDNEDIRAAKGSTLKLMCNFNSSSKTKLGQLALNENILWTKENAGVISINGEIKLNKLKFYTSFLFSADMDVSYTLSIVNLQTQDSGHYMCQNFDHSLIKHFNVIIEGRQF